MQLTFELVAIFFVCSFGWALLDLLRKLIAGHAGPVPSTLLLVSGQIPLFAAWSLAEGNLSFGHGYWLPGGLAVALNLVANLAFMTSVRIAPMSRTVPLLSLTPVFASLIAIPTLGEWPTIVQALGIVLVVGAAVVLASDTGDENKAPGEKGGGYFGLSTKGGWLMALVALCWSVTPSLDKLAMEEASAPLHAFAMTFGITVGLLLMAWQRKQIGEVGELFRNRRALLLTGASVLVAAIAIGVQLLAYQHAPVGLVETVKRGVGASMALVFGALIFSESIGWQRVLALAVMVGGVALVLLV